MNVCNATLLAEEGKTGTDLLVETFVLYQMCPSFTLYRTAYIDILILVNHIFDYLNIADSRFKMLILNQFCLRPSKLQIFD